VARRFSIGSGQCHGTAQQGSMSVGRGLGSAALGGSAEVGWCEVAVGPGMCWSTYVVWYVLCSTGGGRRCNGWHCGPHDDNWVPWLIAANSI